MKMNWNYVAGFFDGEGTVHINHDSMGWRASLYQNTTQVLERIAEFLLEEGIETFPVRSHTPAGFNKGNKSVYELQIRCARPNTVKFLEKLLPLLIVKKTKVQDALRTMKLFPVRRRGPAYLY